MTRIRVPSGVRAYAETLFPGVEQPTSVPAISSTRTTTNAAAGLMTRVRRIAGRSAPMRRPAPPAEFVPTVTDAGSFIPRPAIAPTVTGSTKTNIPAQEPEMRINPSRFSPMPSTYPTRQFDVGGFISDAAGAAARGASAGLEERIRSLVGGGGGGSEPPQGSPAVPGSLVATQNPCPTGQRRIPFTNRCVGVSVPDVLPGGAPFVSTSQAQGQAVLGQFGVALTPDAMERTKLRCPRGMVLGMDDLCYNKRDLRMDERKWRPGRKPLLTGGEMNAISTAARAAGKLARSRARLKKVNRTFAKAC